MSADGTFVNAIVDKTNKPFLIGDRVFVPAGWQETQEKQYAVAPIPLSTLTGLVDYIAENRDDLPRANVMLHVVSELGVALIDRLENEEERYRRNVYAFSKIEAPTAFRFGEYMDGDLFMVALMTQFEPSTTLAQLQRLCGSVRESAVRETVDDGVSQQVQTNRGAHLKENTSVQNPWSLAPRRTFLEIDQPDGTFVLRLRSRGDDERPQFALFEADGGAWRLEAIRRIAAWLRDKLPDVAVLA